jgi:glyoxylase-like metal-dependent hydrolase (beta-lactamase superfamily II)
MVRTARASPLRIGSLLIQPVSDGLLRLDPSNIFADAAPHEWQPYVQRDTHGRVELALTCLLVQAGERRILIDTGFGHRPDSSELGLLSRNLSQLGVAPTDVDLVVISHPHGDHIGGATIGTGSDVRLSYARARYWLGKADWDHFSRPDFVSRNQSLVDKMLPLAAAQQLDLADAEHEIAPGIRLLPLPGHTPGHMGVAFTSSGEMAVYIGDMLHHPLQVEHPDWSPTFDTLPPLSRATRRALLDRARRERSLILSYHLPFPGIGHIEGGWSPIAYTAPQ